MSSAHRDERPKLASETRGFLSPSTLLPVPESPELRKVRSAAQKAVSAREQMIAAMRDARAAGISLRDIATAAGTTHETVRTLTG